MSDQSPSQPVPWICGNCNIPLVLEKVDVAYLGSAFPADLWKCPHCGLVFVPEDLALGKMVDVEKQLEDK